eukprot:snap_masked-scaffold_21-processed-gene-5.61-mRNA-1 protein AED:1.00 eAED:1.00 QI:0/-1/0/0/-1/1/1/0/341
MDFEQLALPPEQQSMAQLSVNTQGLEILVGRKKLLVKQNFDAVGGLLDVTSCGTIQLGNRFDVYDAETADLLVRMEESADKAKRCCCAPNHSFKMLVKERPSVGRKVVMEIHRPFTLGCFPFLNICSQRQTTKLPDGTILGSAEQVKPFGGGIAPKFTIKNKVGDEAMDLTGPAFCVGGLIGNFFQQKFELKSLASEKIKGNIVHLAANDVQEGVSDVLGGADRLLIELQDTKNLDAAAYANLIGTVVLLDYAFYEAGPKAECDVRSCNYSFVCGYMYCCGGMASVKCTFRRKNENKGEEEEIPEHPEAEGMVPDANAEAEKAKEKLNNWRPKFPKLNFSL